MGSEVVDDEGVDVQASADAYPAKLQEFLGGAEADGDTTLKRTGWQLEQAEERVIERLSGTWDEHTRCGMRRGDMMGIPGMGEL